MMGPLHRLARLVRLGLACLVLTAAVSPAQAMPVRPLALAMLVARPLPSPQAVEVRAHVQSVQAPAERLQAPVPAEAGARPPGERTAGPPRRLFLLHRALLR
jgi:hypothetical protein